MSANEIRNQFLEFFKSKGHEIVPSAPIVVKNDPTLMFTNAGMNQFKDWFLGNEQPKYKRVADTQKCLRVSGKHNDLEEVGVDTYHHTMFEMLGNWSFGDYFKKEAIEWAWELLIEVYKLDKDRIYVTVFEGDEKEGLAFDQEAYNEWKKWIAEDRILKGNKKDNFWEMGDTGPCGPCTEIHIDLRSDAERKEKDGATLVNNDDPQVIEVWNNVFMEFERIYDEAKGGLKGLQEWEKTYTGSDSDLKKARASKLLEYTKLVNLPSKSVDTGMGFERLVRAIESKNSNYDTDVFMPYIQFIEKESSIPYKQHEKTDIAMRVLSDHIRTIGFAILDGQLPSNTGAGYVIRRILRRAVRYYYSFLNIREPFLYKLLPIMGESFKDIFPEVKQKKEFLENVIREEEIGFLRTLEKGINKIEYKIKDIAANKLKKILINANILYNKPFVGETIPEIRLAVEANRDYGAFSYNQQSFFMAYLTICMEKQIDAEVAMIPNEPNEPNGLNININIHDIINDNFKDPVFTVNLAGKLKHFEKYLSNIKTDEKNKFQLQIQGSDLFELYDTFGFPIDLTKLIAADYNFTVDEAGFNECLLQQKTRSRKATALETDDWQILIPEEHIQFLGYDQLESELKITRYRKVKTKGKEHFQLVFNQTPFYAESGGQVGDTGTIENIHEKIYITDTQKENNLIIHITDQLPENPEAIFQGKVNTAKRRLTENNHSATHLLHAALRQILGTHVEQKGSLVNNEYLRFDFSHFKAMTDEEIHEVEAIVNKKVRENIALDERRNVPIEEAKKLGAMALFGEKYGDSVRVITFDETYSRELCGGTHVKATGQIGYFKLTSESAVAAGVRRIEAITADAAEQLMNSYEQTVDGLKELLKSKDILKSVGQLLDEKSELQKKLELLEAEKTQALKQDLKTRIRTQDGYAVLCEIIDIPSADQLKNLSFQLKNEVPNLFCVFGTVLNHKPLISVVIGDELVKNKNLHAGNIVKEAAKLIQGGGGGQPFYATAGGNDAAGLKAALELALSKIS
jgi:alanyl-tRNA synthetase